MVRCCFKNEENRDCCSRMPGRHKGKGQHDTASYVVVLNKYGGNDVFSGNLGNKNREGSTTRCGGVSNTRRINTSMR